MGDTSVRLALQNGQKESEENVVLFVEGHTVSDIIRHLDLFTAFALSR